MVVKITIVVVYVINLIAMLVAPRQDSVGSKVAAKLDDLVDELQKLGTRAETSFDKIKAGFAKFKKEIYEANPELIEKLKTGQWPEVMVVACADSRVCPTAVLGLKPGDAFIVRNIANMVPAWEKDGNPSMAAALEYAVLHLKVKHIIVMGHRACGGVGALVKMTPDDGKYTTTFIERWVDIGKPARAAVHKMSPGASVEAICQTCEKESVNNSLSNLLTYPFVKDAMTQGKVGVHGAYYDHIAGSFEKWDLEEGKPANAPPLNGSLQDGFAKFKKEVYEANPELIDKLKTGQWPEMMVVACADSRVCPTTVLGLKPGDAFIVRNIANMVPAWEKEGKPSMAAALEYAVLHLKVKHIMVIGHRACGGVGALVKMTPDDGKYTTTFIERWVQIGKPARSAVHQQLPGAHVDELCKSCEKESVNNSLNNLLTYPFVVDAVGEQKVTLHGGYYDHIAGSFQKWDFGLDKVAREPIHFSA